jgi:hypothetical protein
LALAVKRVITGGELLAPDELYRAALRRISGDGAGPMLGKTSFEIVSVSHVIRII